MLWRCIFRLFTYRFLNSQNREEIRNSSLEELLKTVKNDPYKIPDMIPDKAHGLAGYSLGETNEKYHEAGYDAFITGLCFIALSNRYSNARLKGVYLKCIILSIYWNCTLSIALNFLLTLGSLKNDHRTRQVIWNDCFSYSAWCCKGLKIRRKEHLLLTVFRLGPKIW